MTILITGAGRGIGRALLEAYRNAGAEVIGTCRGTPPAPGRWIRLDVRAEADHAAMAAELAGQPIDLLVCNAGIFPQAGRSLDQPHDAAAWQDAFATNVTGVFQTVQALLPNLRRGPGRIAIIGSAMGSHSRAPGGSYLYRATKAAVLNLGRNLAHDLRPEGIAVGVYHPGWVRTDMGGAGAEIDPERSAQGLAARFADLDLATSGCFRSHDGPDIPF
ncbi:SDR family NAD(P)-dependent oxidoreductase [Plastorhodobacter daqingensis]|uniref:SDR family NAD(P)-dependent oxidoreductase n=1 Tax=Plastorhodobacter daqingensis TaxID=1387281 RepID=A0ABW2UQB9_9RHOB